MTKFGDDLIAALGQALAHVRGDDSGIGAVHRIEVAREAVDVKAVRKRVGLTQDAMARVLDVSRSGYRKWEQHARPVPGPVRTLLMVMQREPEAVMRALAPEMVGYTAAPTSRPTAAKVAGKSKRAKARGGRTGRMRPRRKLKAATKPQRRDHVT
jgi:putative transcriptional regulator